MNFQIVIALPPGLNNIPVIFSQAEVAKWTTGLRLIISTLRVLWLAPGLVVCCSVLIGINDKYHQFINPGRGLLIHFHESETKQVA